MLRRDLAQQYTQYSGQKEKQEAMLVSLGTIADGTAGAGTAKEDPERPDAADSRPFCKA